MVHEAQKETHPTQRVVEISLTEHDVVVLSYASRMSNEIYTRLTDNLTRVMNTPGIGSLILEDGVTLTIVHRPFMQDTKA